ncbi:hypothetical protein F442_07352 [Phytophthora nicotianae P10297]|uniref:Uncharacterized protein n=3 Tax=Phytophthora nicotianae TaxID=4792 RepID=V9FC59_PHYNI|nr:hypothetical protein F443_07286 [Phytophthora nicotianae P1569]ETK88618.1 hypothetical protein L915_07157 [Phytophthora nicotianae]ETP46392.1 hypothetical protein F442_07352 [Phytophthora nicotianae P10297]
MSKILRDLDDADEILSLYERFKPQLKALFPDFEDGMDVVRFTQMAQNAHVKEDQKLLAISAYTKYWFTKHPEVRV